MNTSKISNGTTGTHRHMFLPGILISGLLLGLTACNTTRQQTRGIPEPSGFLVDYSQMQKGVKDRANMFYIKPGVDWNKYTKICFKPVELWKSDDPTSPMGKLSHEDQQQLVNMLHIAAYNALSTNFTTVDQGGPDVLVIHAAITEARKSDPVTGLVSSVYLPLKAISLSKQTVMGTAIGVGSVTIEAELLDGQTNERLWAAVDTRSGTSAPNSKFIGTWGDVNRSFEWWAQRFVTRFNEERAKATLKTTP